ncbi:MAG: hypothetical protein DRR42_20310 [Gammaproteobacteria bacterium]|nr:MAG: hypothetical protein DRR42_20310 [Gammaproteobacteria bacterium]
MFLEELVKNPTSRGLELDFNKRVADTGVMLGHDCFGHDVRIDAMGWMGQPEWRKMAAIYELCEAGYSEQITLGTDTYLKLLTRRFGGRGYRHLTENVLAQCHALGMAEKDTLNMSVYNPARLLAR